MGLPTHLKVFNAEMFLSKGRTGTKNGTETEGRAIQGLPHLGIHNVCRHQTRHCCCGQEGLADRNLVWWFLGRSCQQLTNADVDAWSHQTELRNLLGELSEGVEEQRVIATSLEEQHRLA